MRGKWQPVIPFHFATIALVADDRILAAKTTVSLQVQSREDPMIGTMHDKRCRAVHELTVAAVVATPQETDARQLILGPSHQMMAPRRAQQRCWSLRYNGSMLYHCFQQVKRRPSSSLRTCQQHVLPLKKATFPPSAINCSRWSRIGEDQYSS